VNAEGFLVLALVYVVAVGLSVLIMYLVIRFAVVHAMESLPRRAERSRKSTEDYRAYLAMLNKTRD
jgi:hypothetical protein